MWAPRRCPVRARQRETPPKQPRAPRGRAAVGASRRGGAGLGGRGGRAPAGAVARLQDGVAARDAASIALQAKDMLHGNVLLHGWLAGDVTFYTFELPLFAVIEGVLGAGISPPCMRRWRSSI